MSFSKSKKRTRQEAFGSFDNAQVLYLPKRLHEETITSFNPIALHIIKELKQHRNAYQKSKRIKKPQKFKYRRPMPQHFKLMAILMRYGSLEDFTKRYLKYNEISQALNVKESTLRMLIKKFRDNNYQFKRPNYHKSTKLPQEQINEIIQEDIVKNWAPLSLKERCRMIKFRFDISISATTLRNYYIKAGLKFCKAQYIRHSKYLRHLEIQDKKRRFVQELMLLKIQERQIYFVDQTSFNGWYCKLKTWQFPFQKIDIIQNDLKGQNFTIYGAIDDLNGKFYYAQYDSTTILNFKKFIKHIRDSGGNLEDSIFVLDNHSSHKSDQIKFYLEKYGAVICFLPPYTSELNPIEKLWNIIKSEFRKLLMTTDKVVNIGCIKKEVLKICDCMVKYDMKKFLPSTYPEFLKIIQN